MLSLIIIPRADYYRIFSPVHTFHGGRVNKYSSTRDYSLFTMFVITLEMRLLVMCEEHNDPADGANNYLITVLLSRGG